VRADVSLEPSKLIAELKRSSTRYLIGADFISAQCQKANFEYAQCQKANFEYAQCQGANFECAQCQGANFRSAIRNRAEAMSCGGCHQNSNNTEIAPNVNWPKP
jgi:uncharacterized protein YjbI with pentapeptide repeats